MSKTDSDRLNEKAFEPKDAPASQSRREFLLAVPKRALPVLAVIGFGGMLSGCGGGGYGGEICGGYCIADCAEGCGDGCTSSCTTECSGWCSNNSRA